MKQNAITRICLEWAESLITSNGNLYAYAANNPIKYTDPDGKQVAPSVPLPSLVMELEQFGLALRNSGPQFAVASIIVLGIVAVAEAINFVQNQNLAKSDRSTDARLMALGLSRTKNRNNNYSITFQAQGSGMLQNIRKGKTQGSKVIQVFSNKPITKSQALGALSVLYSELSPNEQVNMMDRFSEAAEWIDEQKCGFAGAYKSIQPKVNPSGNRIDMIFKGGYNLVPDN